MDDLDAPPYVQGRVMELTLKCMYVQGLLPDDPNPDLEFYKQYFSPRVAQLIVDHRYINWTINFVRNFYPWGTLAAMSVQLLIVFPMSIYVNWRNKDVVTQSFFGLILCGMVFMTLQPSFFGRGQFHAVVLRLESLIQDDEKMDEADPKNMLAKLEYWNGVFNQVNIKAVVPMFTLGVISYAALSLIPNRKLFMPGWFPFDVYATPIYELTMLGWSVESVLLFFLSNTLTIYGVFESFYIKVHFDNLCHKLRNIRKIAIRRIRERKRRQGAVWPGAVREGVVMPQASVLDEEVPEVVVEEPPARDASRCDNLSLFRPYVTVNTLGGEALEVAGEGGVAYTRPQPRHVRRTKRNVFGMRSRRQRQSKMGENQKKTNVVDLEGITAEEIDKEMVVQQAKFAKLHQALISLSDDWGACLNTNLMTLYICNLVTFATTALIIKTAEEITFKEIMTAIVCFQFVLVYFLYNYLFDLITDGSSAVAGAVYDCDWFEASKSFKVSMLIMMSRANVAIQITPTALNPLSLSNFAEVAESAYKMLATMESFM